MEIREASPFGAKSWRKLVLVGALLFVAGGVWFLVRSESDRPTTMGQKPTAMGEEEPSAARPPSLGQRPWAKGENSRQSQSAMQNMEDENPPLPTAHEAEDDSTWEQDLFEQQAIDRFDQNARDFEDRLMLFEAEGPRPDNEAASLVRAHILSELSSIEDQLDVKAECTASVCSIEMNNGRSVGSLVASVAGWLRRHPENAIGDPLDEEDDQTMRVLFLREDTPGLKQP